MIQMEAAKIKAISEEYMDFVGSEGLACIAAKAALHDQAIHCMVAAHIACPNDDTEILQFLYDFVDRYRNTGKPYQSAVIIFDEPKLLPEELFDQFMWQRLQSLANLDAVNYKYDSRVSPDPGSAYFSFSIKEEAFYIVGLHQLNNRKSRQFKYPAIVFNPHQQFERLRQTNKFENIKKAIRKKDLALSGSVNPMLEDFGKVSEAFQYSGRKYDPDWQCPLNLNFRK